MLVVRSCCHTIPHIKPQAPSRLPQDIMSFTLEALAMAGVDYDEWGMDIKEWEHMEMGVPPPYLCADDYEGEEHELEHEKDKRVVTMETKPKIQLRDTFVERNNEGSDDFVMKTRKTFNEIMNHCHGIK
ncbi:hypothetical protein R6Q57_026176 [Mikania cordata]